MTVHFPDHIPAVSALSEDEIKAALAVSLYARRRLTLVQAADLAGLGLFSFQQLLREQQVPQHYDAAALEQDLVNLAGLRAR